jgi:hypothetical protein
VSCIQQNHPSNKKSSIVVVVAVTLLALHRKQLHHPVRLLWDGTGFFISVQSVKISG